MNIKLIGSALVIVSGFLFGYGHSSRLRKQECSLRELSTCLCRMENELLLLQSPLPQIFEKLSDCRFFRFLSVGFEEEPLEQLWMRAAEAMNIPQHCRRSLASLSRVIGRYDAAHQAAEISLVREQLSAAADEIGRELSTRGKSYAGLGAAMGAMLAVTLF